MEQSAEIETFLGLLTLAQQQALKGSATAQHRLGRWRVKYCDLSRAALEGSYTAEQRAAVDRWLTAIGPRLFA